MCCVLNNRGEWGVNDVPHASMTWTGLAGFLGSSFQITVQAGRRKLLSLSAPFLPLNATWGLDHAADSGREASCLNQDPGEKKRHGAQVHSILPSATWNEVGRDCPGSGGLCFDSGADSNVQAAVLKAMRCP